MLFKVHSTETSKTLETEDDDEQEDDEHSAAEGNFERDAWIVEQYKSL